MYSAVSKGLKQFCDVYFVQNTHNYVFFGGKMNEKRSSLVFSVYRTEKYSYVFCST